MKVKTKMTITETAKLLMQHDNYILLTHRRPDGDTLGSAAALCSALRRAGKNAWLMPNPGTTERLSAFVGKFFAAADMDVSGCTAVAVDVAAPDMLPAGFPEDVFLSVDHHPSNPHYAEHTLLQADKAACGQIILDLIEELCSSVTKEEADLLYIALSTDTGCFQFGNTDAAAFAAASRLAEYGADVAGLNVIFFRTISKARLTLEGFIYAELRSYMDNRINIAVITREMIDKAGATENDMDALAALPGRVEGNLIAATIKETSTGTSKVSLRCSGDYNVAEICARFGGGGHKLAAGCEIQAPPREAAEILRPIMEAAIS